MHTRKRHVDGTAKIKENGTHIFHIQHMFSALAGFTIIRMNGWCFEFRLSVVALSACTALHSCIRLAAKRVKFISSVPVFLSRSFGKFYYVIEGFSSSLYR